MTTVVAEVKALVSGVRVAGAIARRLSPTSVQEGLDRATDKVQGEAVQISYAVCRAILKHALGREAGDDEVSSLMEAGINDPTFPHRAFRLLGEARKTASQRRRAFLAAMLFGLPFCKLPDDERDRVDMVVERIVPADVELLTLIVEKDKTACAIPDGDESPLFRGTRVAALLHGLEVRVATTSDYEGFGDPTYDDDRFRVDHTAFASLLSAGCIDIGISGMSQGPWRIHTLVVTSLGRLVSQAIEELRPAFDGAAIER